MKNIGKQGIPIELQDSNAVAYAKIDLLGGLIISNKGFNNLLEMAFDHSSSSSLVASKNEISHMFIQPDFSELLQAIKGNANECFNGLFTVGSYLGGVQSLKGSIQKKDGYLLFLAEYDIAEFVKLQRSILTLNNDLAESQRELARLNQGLEQLVKKRTQELENALLESNETKEQLKIVMQDKSDILDSIVDGVITIDENCIVLTFNAGAEELFGYSSEEVIGNNINMLMPEKYSVFHDSYMNNYLQTGKQKIIGIGRDVSAKRKDNTVFPMHLSVAEMSHLINNKRRFIGSCVDLTENTQQQEMLRRSQKMDSLGMLTSGIAHDYNNMLAVMLGFSDLIYNSVEKDSKVASYALNIHHSGERGAKLTKKLLAFSKKESSDSVAVNINDILIEEKNMIEKTLTPRIQVRLKLTTSVWMAWLDKNDFEDALINLCINSMHAINDSGKISIETDNRVIDELLGEKLQIEAGEYVVLSVSDTGSGMDEATKEKIFDPFFTTKGDKGTGLGLSQVFGFVKRCHGAIDVSSELGKGSTFTIYFPRYTIPVRSIDSAQNDTTQSIKGSEVVLIVDDEQGLLELNKELLSINGYKVFTALSGREALDVLEIEKIDLLLSDVIMPEMNGYELAAIVRDRFPGTKIQLISGYTDSAGLKEEDKKLYSKIIHKPYNSKDLLQRLRALLV